MFQFLRRRKRECRHTENSTNAFESEIQRSKSQLRQIQTVVSNTPVIIDHDDSEVVMEEVVVEVAKNQVLHEGGQSRLACENWEEVHGFLGNSEWENPIRATFCEEDARPGYATKAAHEYLDVSDVLSAKVALLASLMVRSKATLLYTGAGISTASGIGDYATRTSDGCVQRPKLRSPLEAQPTFAHHALALMGKENLINYWVQQNHDGLPQKAGYPQHLLNEIHGAWFDPSNPVVPMSGQLRGDLFRDMLKWEQSAELTISLGTSMCGMNSDRVFVTPATKARRQASSNRRGNALGGVIVGLQQTQYDEICSLRIFAKIDDVMELLLQQLHLSAPAPHMYSIPSHIQDGCESEDRFLVPYTSTGVLSVGGQLRVLDLREGSRVRLASGPHAGDEGEVMTKDLQGNYRIRFFHPVKGRKQTTFPFVRLLGSWWAEEAVEGRVPYIPIVSILD